jgi:hypothetical protein
MTAVTHSQPSKPQPHTGPTAADIAIADHDNDSLVLRLHMTINHLSRWLTPITDPLVLERTARHGEPSVKQLLQRMRDEELLIFPKMFAIANYTNPDLDQIPDPRLDPERLDPDYDRTPLMVMAEFRRLRQSTCSLLRGLPDSAWYRVGTSRREHDWQIRMLAEHLANHDYELLYEIDITLDRTGARKHVSAAARVHLLELLKLIPAQRISR